MQQSSRQHKGFLGEDIASTYLQKKGYQIIDKNVHSQFGEIDLVALYQQILVFIEVKTRLQTAYGEPEEAVTYYKMKKLTKCAQLYKLQHPHLPETLQIDVIAILLSAQGVVNSLEHLENVTS